MWRGMRWYVGEGVDVEREGVERESEMSGKDGEV